MVLLRLCSVRGRSPGAQVTGRARLVDTGDTGRAGSTSTAEEFAVETIADGVVLLKTQIVYKMRANFGVVLPAFLIFVHAPACDCAGWHSWNRACSKFEESDKMLELWAKKEAPLSLVFHGLELSCLLISDHISFIQNIFAGFHLPVWLFDYYRVDCSKYSKTPKGHTTTAVVSGLHTGFAAGHGWGW